MSKKFALQCNESNKLWILIGSKLYISIEKANCPVEKYLDFVFVMKLLRVLRRNNK